MFWTAEALLACYRVTGDARYLRWGRRTLDEMGMTQQVWQPPYIYIPALGGFGVMNFDGEWNDSRQCLFAELFMDYYRETGEVELFERGIVALKAAFVMMYCPENPEVKALWEQVWPFFGPAGLWLHHGELWAYRRDLARWHRHWRVHHLRSGAMARLPSPLHRIRDHFGDLYIDVERGRAFAINGVSVSGGAAGQYTITNLAHSARDLRVMTANGESRQVRVEANGVTQIRLA